jgi:hypothetical protein
MTEKKTATLGRRIARTAIALGITASALALAQVPAEASAGQCSDNRLCGWHNQSFTGTFANYTTSQGNLGADGDEFHSLWNRSATAWYVRDDANHVGHAYCVKPGYSVEDLGRYGLGDKISSVAKRATSPDCQATTTQIGSFRGN